MADEFEHPTDDPTAEEPEAPREPAWRRFGLPSLLAACAAAAALGILLLGWGGPLVILVANAAGIFLGLLALPLLGLDCPLDDPKRDAAKCLALAALVVLPTYGVLRLLPYLAAAACIAMIAVFGFLVKVCWADLEPTEIVVVIASSLFASGAGIVIVAILF